MKIFVRTKLLSVVIDAPTTADAVIAMTTDSLYDAVAFARPASPQEVAAAEQASFTF